MIVFAAIVPHPLPSIPGIGKVGDFEKLEKTLNAFESLRIGLEQANPDAIIIISPHARLEPYAFVINSAPELVGSFASHGLDLEMTFKNELELATQIDYDCLMIDEFPVDLHTSFLDHGTLVPLYHLTKNIKPKIVQLSFSLMNYERHYRYGQIIENIIGKHSNKRIAVIASGDLSHKLSINSPAGFSPTAEVFDRSLLHFLGKNDLTSILGIRQETVQEAAECGVRSIIVLLGMLHDEKYKFELLSYESPFGIGHLTARLI